MRGVLSTSYYGIPDSDDELEYLTETEPVPTKATWCGIAQGYSNPED
jgi:hypothetical protein